MHRGEHKHHHHGKSLPWYVETTFKKRKSIFYAHGCILESQSLHSEHTSRIPPKTNWNEWQFPLVAAAVTLCLQYTAVRRDIRLMVFAGCLCIPYEASDTWYKRFQPESMVRSVKFLCSSRNMQYEGRNVSTSPYGSHIQYLRKTIHRNGVLDP